MQEWPDLDLDMFDQVMAQESEGAPSMYGSDQWMAAQAAPTVQPPAAQQPVAQTGAQQRRAAAALIDDQVAILVHKLCTWIL